MIRAGWKHVFGAVGISFILSLFNLLILIDKPAITIVLTIIDIPITIYVFCIFIIGVSLLIKGNIEKYRYEIGKEENVENWKYDISDLKIYHDGIPYEDWQTPYLTSNWFIKCLEKFYIEITEKDFSIIYSSGKITFKASKDSSKIQNEVSFVKKIT